MSAYTGIFLHSQTAVAKGIHPTFHFLNATLYTESQTTEWWGAFSKKASDTCSSRSVGYQKAPYEHGCPVKALKTHVYFAFLPNHFDCFETHPCYSSFIGSTSHQQYFGSFPKPPFIWHIRRYASFPLSIRRLSRNTANIQATVRSM